MDAPGQVRPRTQNAFDFGGVVPGLVSGGFGLYALAQVLLVVRVLKDASWQGDGTLSNLTLLFTILAVLLMSGALVLGGAFGGRLPGWARVTLVSVGVFVISSSSGGTTLAAAMAGIFSAWGF